MRLEHVSMYCNRLNKIHLTEAHNVKKKQLSVSLKCIFTAITNVTTYKTIEPFPSKRKKI